MNNATTLIRAATKSQMDCDLLGVHFITPITKINRHASKIDDRELCPFEGLKARKVIAQGKASPRATALGSNPIIPKPGKGDRIVQRECTRNQRANPLDRRRGYLFGSDN